MKSTKETAPIINTRKESVSNELKSLRKLQSDEKMKLALKLACSTKKIERYVSGQVANIQFAELLMWEAKKLTK
jgi:hypothetical protein